MGVPVLQPARGFRGLLPGGRSDDGIREARDDERARFLLQPVHPGSSLTSLSE